MKITLWFFGIIFISSLFIRCNNPLKKSIFEPLTVEELKKVIEKDTSFREIYKGIRLVRDSIEHDELEKVNWIDLTYQRLQDYYDFANDTSYFNPLKEQFKREWELKYGGYHLKVDSISNYWKKYKKENSLERFVKIELFKLRKDRYSYSNDIKDIYLGFRLTPLKGRVQQLVFNYKLQPKIDEGKVESRISTLLNQSRLNQSRYFTSTPFSYPIVRYWEVDYTNEKLLSSKTLATLKRDYNIFIEIEELRKDDTNFSVDDLEIPQNIKFHWEHENNEIEILRNLYADDIIREFVDKDYRNERSHIIDKVSKILIEKDSLSFAFYLKRNKLLYGL